MSSLDLNKLHIDFDPPLWKKPRRRRRSVLLTTENGVILGGITVDYPKGAGERIEILEALTILNRPESGDATVPLSPLDREALITLIREKLHYRPDPSPPPGLSGPGESVRLLCKARAARSGRRN